MYIHTHAPAPGGPQHGQLSKAHFVVFANYEYHSMCIYIYIYIHTYIERYIYTCI